jgi:yeast amino acid transporter
MTSWVCCCIIFLRFRGACKAQDIEVPYKSWIQPYGAYIAMVSFTILCLINGFTVFFPAEWSVSSFFTAYIGIPIFFVVSSLSSSNLDDTDLDDRYTLGIV